MSSIRSDASWSDARSDEPPNASSSTHQDILIRAARQSDLDQLTQVLTSSFHTPDGPLGWMYPLLRLGIRADLRGRLWSNESHRVILVATCHPQMIAHPPSNRPVSPAQGHIVVGTVEVGLKTLPFPLWQFYGTRYVYLSNLAVEAQFRRQGVAQQLLLASERIARDWGFHDLYLHTLENNRPAQRLYTKAGFTPQRIEPSLGHWLLNQPRQVFLHKRLQREP